MIADKKKVFGEAQDDLSSRVLPVKDIVDDEKVDQEDSQLIKSPIQKMSWESCYIQNEDGDT